MTSFSTWWRALGATAALVMFLLGYRMMRGKPSEYLDAADLVLAVGAADPVGVQRLVRGLAELAEADVATPVQVVVNKLRPGAVPGDPQAEVAAALSRFAGREPVAFLPADPPALDACLAVGRTLGEVRPDSPLRAAVADLAASIAGVPAAGGRRRGRRRGGRRRAG